MNNQQAALLWAYNLCTRELASAKSRHESTKQLEQHRKELSAMLNEKVTTHPATADRANDLILAIAKGVETLAQFRPEAIAGLQFIENATEKRLDCYQAITAITVKLDEVLQTLEQHDIAEANRDAALSTLATFEAGLLSGRE